MKLLRNILTVALLFIASSKSFGQIDSVFWFAAPWVTVGHANNVPVVLRISTFNAPTTVRVWQPAGTYDSTFVVPPNSLNSHDLSSIINTLESKPANTALNYGLKIEADTLITVVYEVVTAVNNPETYSLKGQNGIGTEFICPFQTSWGNGAYAPLPKSMICIVATEDNTTVWITPKTNIVGHPANVTFSIVLQKGQTYTAENTVQTTNIPGNNLSGTIVVSDKPISVTVSDDSVRSSGGGCRDLAGDQIVPVDVLGTEYIVNKGNMFAASNEGIYVVATENYTTVTFIDALGTTTQLLNQGDTWNRIMTQSVAYVSSDKPIYVLQASGFGCEVGEALLPPINCAGSSQVSFTRTNAQTFILNILCPTSAINNFLLNGSSTLVPGSAFVTVPGTGGFWSGAQITFTTAQIPSGTSNFLINTSDFFGLGVINGGAGTGCLFHYMSSFNRKVFVNAGADQFACSGEPNIPLAGTVTGGAITGAWETVNGTGTFSTPNSLSTNYAPSASDYAQGGVRFVLRSTGNCDPVRDTVEVTFIQSPTVEAGNGQTYCENNVTSIPINGLVTFAAAGTWSGGNGGVFGNSGSPSTTYTPSLADLSSGSVTLYYTSVGSFFACPNRTDSVQFVFTPKPTILPGGDITVCSNTPSVPLSGTITGGTTTGIWTSNGTGGFSPSQTALNGDYILSSSDITAGEITLYLQSTNNGDCLAEMDSIKVTIIDFPVVTITTDDSICSSNTSINFTGTVSGGFSSIWTTSGLGTIASPTNLNTVYSVSPIDPSTGYIDVILSSTGICPPEKDSIRILFVNPPSVLAGSDLNYCANEMVQLNGTITGTDTTGTWSTLGTGGFFPSPNFVDGIYQPSIADVGNGSVSLVLSSATTFGCPPDKDTLTIVFDPIPTADFNSNAVCQGANTVFSDLSTNTSGTITAWEWNFGDAGTSIVQNPSHNYSTNGNIGVTLIVTSNNGCKDTVTKTVTVHPIPSPSFTSPEFCVDAQNQLTNTSFISSGVISSYLYDFGGLGTSTSEDPFFTFNTVGTYSVTLSATSSFGCVGTTTQQVIVNPLPTADFTASPLTALVNQTITFTDQSSGSIQQWLWDFGNGEGDNLPNTSNSYPDGGVYDVTLVVTDQLGCEDEVTKQISIVLLPVLPTGFTPNGDGENDVFIIRGGPFKTVDFKVYNNWGQLIFETNDGTVGWDGTFKGEPAPLGVYTWTFVVDIGDGVIYKESGDVTLMR